MEQIPQEVIILGAGLSIEEGKQKGLYEKIKNRFTIGLNLSYKEFDSTIVMFVDEPFYEREVEQLKKLPLVIGVAHGIINPDEHPNFILFRNSGTYYGKDSIKQNKIYSTWLVGIFSLTFSIALGCKQAYLLGYDWGIDKTNIKKNGNQIALIVGTRLK